MKSFLSITVIVHRLIAHLFVTGDEHLLEKNDLLFSN